MLHSAFELFLDSWITFRVSEVGLKMLIYESINTFMLLVTSSIAIKIYFCAGPTSNSKSFRGNGEFY